MLPVILLHTRSIEFWYDKSIGQDLEGSGHGLLEVLPLHIHRDTEKKTHKKTVRIAGAPAKIRTEYLLNTSLERYRFTNRSV
jgi:hypothetical protein